MADTFDVIEKKIRDLIVRLTEEGRLPFDTIIGTKKKDLLPYYDEIKDIRMDNNTIENRYISVLAVENETRQLCGSINFIMFTGALDKINFWKMDKGNNIFYKIALKDLALENSETAMTIGYTENYSNNERNRQVMTLTVLKLVKEILKEQPLVFIESTGKINVEKELREKTVVKIHEAVPEELMNSIGATREESKAVDKFAKVLGLKEIEHCYNLRTLGKIFVS